MTRKEKMLRFKYRFKKESSEIQFCLIFGCSHEYLQKNIDAVLTHSYAFLLKFTKKDRKIVFVLQLAAEWMGSEMIVMRSGWCSQVT